MKYIFPRRLILWYIFLVLQTSFGKYYKEQRRGRCLWIRCNFSLEDKCPENYFVTAKRHCPNRPGRFQLKCCPITRILPATATPSTTTTTTMTPPTTMTTTTLSEIDNLDNCGQSPEPEKDIFHFVPLLPIICSRTDVFPYQVALGRFNNNNDLEHFCDGIIYSAKLILTSAACALGENKDAILVLAGLSNLNSLTRKGQILYVEEIIVHNNYDSAKQYADIAFLKLNSDIRFNEFVSPATFSKLASSNVCRVLFSGWVDNGDSNQDFRKSDAFIVPDEACNRRGVKKLYFYYNFPSQICVQSGWIIPKSCSSLKRGGPLTSPDGKIVHGILSGTLKYDTHVFPYHVFTEVSYFHEWLTYNFLKY